MNVLQFRKAERRKAKLRLGISGPSGAGKTYSTLLVAMGLGEKIAMIDTENGSGDLYSHLCDYDIVNIKAPFTPEKYTGAIRAAEEAGYGTIIIDSLTHAWAGEGGLLDLQGKIVDSGKGNSYTAWRSVTPKHNALVEAMLQSKCHIIATIRSKMEYVQQSNNGKTEIKKVGLAPIQRDGMEYEFTVFFDLNHDHTASASKDRTTLFDGQYFILSQETGEKLKAWLDSGAEMAEATANSKDASGDDNEDKAFFDKQTTSICKELSKAITMDELKRTYEKHKNGIELMPDENRKLIMAHTNTLKKSIADKARTNQKGAASGA
jgi:hypothetical protein